jgi:signal transduction histidine kinase
MANTEDTSFARLVSLACHDLRTPLATVHGFARTILRQSELDEPTSRYLGMIEAASQQLAHMLEELSLVARIEGGRYDPNLQESDSLELAGAVRERLGEKVDLSGTGALVRVEPEAAARALADLAECALRHGGLEQVELRVDGATLAISPVTPASGPVLLGEELRDLGAAVAVIVIRALRGSVSVNGDTLAVKLPE